MFAFTQTIICGLLHVQSAFLTGVQIQVNLTYFKHMFDKDSIMELGSLCLPVSFWFIIEKNLRITKEEFMSQSELNLLPKHGFYKEFQSSIANFNYWLEHNIMLYAFFSSLQINKIQKKDHKTCMKIVIFSQKCRKCRSETQYSN